MASALRRLPLFLLSSLCFFSSFSALAQQAPDAETLLIRVADALGNTSYRGRVTYEHSGQLELVEVIHGVTGGMAVGHIDYLNGPQRTLARQAQRRDCALGRRLLAGETFAQPNGQMAALQAAYDFHMVGVDRVAGRASWVLQLVPKDEHRHGFILAVDQASYLPTKILFLAAGSKVLERLHFVSLETDVSLDPSLLASAIENGGEEVSGKCSYTLENNDAHWIPGWLPEGFVRAHYQYSDSDGHMETYTDGLTSFSIFTKQTPNVAANTKQQAAESRGIQTRGFKKGATVVVVATRTDLDPPVDVSVLGEIPNATAKRILASVQAR